MNTGKRRVPWQSPARIPRKFAQYTRSDAGANRPQQERRKMRMIGRLLLGLALSAPRFGAADRGDPGSRRGGRGHERFGRGLRLRVAITATPGMPWLRMPWF